MVDITLQAFCGNFNCAAADALRKFYPVASIRRLQLP
jgi:hypothetical protein